MFNNCVEVDFSSASLPSILMYIVKSLFWQANSGPNTNGCQVSHKMIHLINLVTLHKFLSCKLKPDILGANLT